VKSTPLDPRILVRTRRDHNRDRVMFPSRCADTCDEQGFQCRCQAAV